MFDLTKLKEKLKPGHRSRRTQIDLCGPHMVFYTVVDVACYITQRFIL